MAPYRVNLEVFAGPLDLLLYLVRKDEVDIYDISIARITEQYIHYIEMLKSLDIDVAGDFLVMAATLMQIKSGMLLPKAEPDELEGEDLSDPRAELVRQLLEYKKFKDAANLLDAAAQQQSERLNRPATIINSLKDDSEPELDLDQVSIWDLLESFDSILQATGATFDLSHIPDDTPIDLYQIEILHRLQTEGAIPFERLFESKTNRLAMVGLFLALLELVRDRLVAAEQQQGSEAIYLSALTDELAEQAVRNAILSASAEPEKPVESVSEPTKSAEPAIPITEIPAKEKTSAETVRWAEAPVPIEELPPESKRRTEPAQGPVSNHTADSDEPNDG